MKGSGTDEDRKSESSRTPKIVNDTIEWVKNNYRRKAFIATVVSLLVILVFELSVPNNPPALISAIAEISIVIFSAVLGASILTLVFDSEEYENRILRITKMYSDDDRKRTVDAVKKLLLADASILGILSKGDQRRLMQKLTYVHCDLNDADDLSIKQLVDRWLSESEMKLCGLYSSDVDIKRKYSAHRSDITNQIDSWRVEVTTGVTIKNGSTNSVPTPPYGDLISSRIEGNPEYAKWHKVDKYRVMYDGRALYDSEDLAATECEYVSKDGTRVWRHRFPKSEEIPKMIEPGKSISYTIHESFYIPPREEVKIRWRAPRKGVSFRVEVDRTIADVKPVVSLTGCSLCGNTRKHRCRSCVKQKNSGLVEIVQATTRHQPSVKVSNEWVGSEVGVNIDWVPL